MYMHLTDERQHYDRSVILVLALQHAHIQIKMRIALVKCHTHLYAHQINKQI